MWHICFALWWWTQNLLFKHHHCSVFGIVWCITLCTQSGKWWWLKSRKAEPRFEAEQSIRSAASQTFPVHLVGCAHLSTFALVGRMVHMLLCATMCTHAGPNPDLFPPRYAPLCQPVLIYLAVNILRARLYVANRGWSMQVSLEPGFASFTIANAGTVTVTVQRWANN